MFDYKRYFDICCAENGIEVSLSFDMPQGYETADGTFDFETKTVYINKEYLSQAPDYEQAFVLYHELRHAAQYLSPERFSAAIIRSLPYTIMFDGTCYKLADGRYLECRLEGGKELFTDVYLGQPYEVDANRYAYEKVRTLFGDSEELRRLYDFRMPNRHVPDDEYAAYYAMIDEKAK